MSEKKKDEKKPRAEKYEDKLIIDGTLDGVLKASVSETKEKSKEGR